MDRGTAGPRRGPAARDPNGEGVVFPVELASAGARAPAGPLPGSRVVVHRLAVDRDRQRDGILLRSGMAELLVMFPPFPTAPAGEGARWRAQFGGVAGPVVVDYVLTRLDGHRFTVTATFDASAFAGVPGMTPIAHHAAEETARMVIEGTTRESSVRRATSTYTLEVDVPRSGGETLPLTQSAELVLR